MAVSTVHDVPAMAVMTATILHSCGHSGDRRLGKFDPYKRVVSELQNIEPLKPPEALLEYHRASVEKAVKYWEERVCAACYIRNQQS